MGETLLVVEKLRIESNPFDAGAGGWRLGRPLQKTLGEVIRQIGLETPVVVVSGSTGTGKTLLAKMAKRTCADMGLSVRHIHRGDVVEVADGQRSDVLLVDEADSMPDSTLRMLLFEGDKRPATTTVLLCLPAFIRRFSTIADAVVVELTRLSQSDTRHYLQARATHAGFPDLFAPAAFDLIVDGSRGVPRSLWSIAGLAYFYAASAGASQISRQHVADALASQIVRPEIPEVAVPTAPSVKLVTETPVRNPAAPPVANPPRTSESVAVFPGGINLGLGPIKRGDSAEPPTPQMPRSEPQEALVWSTPAAVTPTIGTIIRRLEPIARPISELPKSIAAAPDRSAAPDGELPIDGQKVESPKSAQAVSIGFARANAGTERGAARRPLVIVGSAVGVAIALAAAVAIFVQPTSLNEKAAVATDAENTAVMAPVVANQPSATPANHPNAAGQATDKGGAAKKTAGLSNPSKPGTDQSLISAKAATTKATQRTRRTKAARVPASAVAPQAPTTAAVVVPLENNAVNAAPVQANAAGDTGNPPNSAEADAIAAAVVTAQQQAEHDRMAKEAAAQAQAAAIREADAKAAANHANALARAAAKALAAKEAKDREKMKLRAFVVSSRFRLNY